MNVSNFSSRWISSLIFLFADGDHGSGNMTVDIQRNRVLAADALKRAEELGDTSRSDF